MKFISILPILCLLAACYQKAAPAAEDKDAELASGNKISCLVGDLQLAGTGPHEVEIAGFGIHANTLNAIGLNLTVEHAGKLHIVSTSLMSLPMHAGTYYFPSLDSAGMTFASYDIRTKDHDLLKAYEGSIYSQHFSPIDNDPEAKLKIQVDKMTVSAADLPDFKRVHAVGHFQFNGAALPGSTPSKACVSSGIARSMASAQADKRLLPLFDAAVCGTEKKHIQCDFDVVQDFVTQQ